MIHPLKANEKYLKVIQEMEAGRCLLIDGATGTELERRGVPQLKNAWNGGGSLSHPEVLKDIHKSYLESGARVIISNTFATCKHTLEDAGEVKNFYDLNSSAIKLAKASCADLENENALVAGAISYWSFTGQHPSLTNLKSNISEQAIILAEAGADLLILEMMVDIDRLMVTLEAAADTHLPVWVGVSCKLNEDDKMCLLNGEPLQKAIRSIPKTQVDLINIMHTDVGFVDGCLEILSSEWSGLTGVYAHSGEMVGTEWTFNNVISKKEYAQFVSRWLTKGINLVGGCCGITTEHMSYLSKKFQYLISRNNKNSSPKGALTKPFTYIN